MITKEEIAQMIKEGLKDPNSMVPVVLTELLMLREQLRPQPPSETPLRQYSNLLLINIGFGCVCIGSYNSKEGTWWDDDGNKLENVISWMPLPFMEIEHEND